MHADRPDNRWITWTPTELRECSCTLFPGRNPGSRRQNQTRLLKNAPAAAGIITHGHRDGHGSCTGRKTGGARRDRTDDLLLAKQALSQLSYGPAMRCTPSYAPGELELWWVWVELNYRPHPYQGCALTN